MKIQETQPIYQAVNRKMVQYERLKNVLESDYVRNLRKITQKYNFDKKLDYRIRFRDKSGFKSNKRESKEQLNCSPELPKFSRSKLSNLTQTPISFAGINSPKSRMDYTPKNLKFLRGRPKRSRGNVSYLDRHPKQDFDSL